MCRFLFLENFKVQVPRPSNWECLTFPLRRQLMDLDTLIVAYLSVVAVMGTAKVQTLLFD